MIVQKIDKRKREKGFSIPIFPLLIIIGLAISLVLIPSEITPRFATNGTSLALEKQNYRGNEQLQGKLKLTFLPGEFLPLETNATFRILALYPWYYVCEDSKEYEWVDIDGKSVLTGGNYSGDWPEYDLCQNYYEEPFVERNCTHYNKKCCPYGVAGKVYINLRCYNTPEPFGYCGDECIPTRDIFTLAQLISKSTTPTKGNFTNAPYKFFNWTTSTLQALGGSGYGVGYCYNTSGITVQPRSYLSCNDSDGINPYFRGTCRDIYGNEIQDSCIDSNVGESYCGEGTFIKKEECAFCSEPKCMYIGTDSEGWYTNCSNITTRIKYAECGNLSKAFAPVCIKGSLGEGWYEPYKCYSMTMMIENCNCTNGACVSPLGNCSGWNNTYEISLQNLALQRTPSKRAYYLLVFNLNYGNISIIPKDNLTAGFYVTEQPRYKACRNYRCVYVSGEGEDECETDYDCRACIPNWTITWGPCVNNVQYGYMRDLNGCFPDRTINRTCQVTYQPVWSCEWKRCEGNLQRKVCYCTENCDPTNQSYVIEERECCIENWKCEKWSKCENGIQTRRCVEVNNCTTEFEKPITRQACGPESKNLLWLLIIIITITVLFFFFMKEKIKHVLFGSRERHFSHLQKGRVNLPEPPKKVEDSDKILEQIRKAFAAGFTKQEIEEMLLRRGWSREVIEEAFKKLLG